MSQENPHQLCKHKHSCIVNTLMGAVRGGVIGLGIRGVLSLFSLVLKRRIFKDPKSILSIFSKSNLKLPCLLASMVVLFRGTLCLCRKYTKDEEISAFAAGFASGIPLCVESSGNRVVYSLYVLAKALDVAVKHLVKLGYLPKIPYFPDILYGISMTILQFARVWEPDCVNKGYYSMTKKFMIEPNDHVLGVMVKPS